MDQSHDSLTHLVGLSAATASSSSSAKNLQVAASVHQHWRGDIFFLVLFASTVVLFVVIVVVVSTL